MLIEELPNSTEELSTEMLNELRELAKSDLFFFCKGVLGYDWFDIDIHGPACDILQNLGNTEVLIVLPRGWQKSTLVSICYPIWRAINDCNITILLVQNTATNAEAKLGVIKGVFETNQLFRALFPELLPDDSCKWKTGFLEVKRTKKSAECTFEAIGIGGNIVGRHYNEVIEDDTVAPDSDDMNASFAIPSKELVEKAIGFHKSLTSIITDIGKTGRSLVVGTRWAERDLLSEIIKLMGKKLAYYSRAVRENDKGEADEKGKVTFPKRFDSETLEIIANRWGPYMFSCNIGTAPVLMADWSSKPFDEIKVGDRVVGFEIEDGENMRSVMSEVQAVHSKMSEVVKVTMMSGREIVCTPDHRWLSKPNKRKERPEQVYMPVKLGRQMNYVCDPEIPEPNPEANVGWLAGMFDGEGSAGKHLSIAQSKLVNPKIHAEICRQLDLLGLRYTAYDTTIVFGTCREDRRRFLAWCHPFVKWEKVFYGLYGARFIQEKDHPVKIEPAGVQRVYSMQTTTGNYVAWGYASKNCLYMNKPVRAEDMIFQPEWFQFYLTEPLQLDVYTTVDLAGDPEQSQTSDPDWTVVLTCGKDKRTGRVFVLDYTRERCDPGRQVKMIFEHVRRWKPLKVGLPKVAYEASLEYWVKEEMKKTGVFFITHMIHYGNKAKSLRIMGLQPVFQAKAIFLREWMVELTKELLAFPIGSHDDLIDALAEQLEFWNVTVGEKRENILEVADPLDYRAAVRELRERNSKKDGFFGELLGFQRNEHNFLPEWN